MDGFGYGIFGWGIVGLIAGALAKWLHPGRDPGGIVATMLIGIAGAFVGGTLGRMIGLGPGGDLWNLVLATGGAILLLAGWRWYHSRKG
jgi:uncharacterized membrane protein YeaQ/YmgE (transglycosylase-associated protein family)